MDHYRVKILLGVKGQTKGLDNKEAKKRKYEEKATTAVQMLTQAKLVENHHCFHLMKFGCHLPLCLYTMTST